MPRYGLQAFQYRYGLAAQWDNVPYPVFHLLPVFAVLPRLPVDFTPAQQPQFGRAGENIGGKLQ